MRNPIAEQEAVDSVRLILAQRYARRGNKHVIVAYFAMTLARWNEWKLI